MKKSEIIAILQAANVKSSNVKSFVNKNKKLNLDIEKCAKWLREIEAIEAKKAEQAELKAKARAFGMSVKKYIELKAKAERILEWFHTGHSMGCYKKMLIGDNKLFVRVDRTQEYAKSSKYKAIHGSFYIKLTKSQLENIQFTATNAFGGRVRCEVGALYEVDGTLREILYYDN